MIGQVLGHYRIDAQLGAGGMGVVYRAYDTRLRRTVAIKLLGGAPDSESRARLLSEARAASALNHPNICTVYEVAEADGRMCIVMEYVEGGSLKTMIPAGGLPPGVAIKYGLQIADALTHAHNNGVIHRDLKSANIVVTSDGRVKVLDFGLARRLPGSVREDVTQSQASMVGHGEIAGTIAYMAPELLGGVSADARSDIWALGIVLYEITCGTLPFKGQTGLDLAAAIFHKPIPDLPPSVAAPLRAVIARCLKKEPWQRYERADEVRAALENCERAPSVRSRRLPFWLAVGAALIFAVGLGVYRLSWFQPGTASRQAAPPSTKAAVTPRRAVAVLGFKNLSGQPAAAWMSMALSEMLTTELAAGETLRTIPGENVARMKNDLTLSEADSFAPDTLARIRSNLGTDLVVSGSYVAVGERIRFDVRLQDTAAGETIASVAETGTTAELLEVVSRLGARLRGSLGVVALSAADLSQLRASLPANAETARLYADGLARLRLFDAQAAKASLERAVAAEPGLPLAHSSLAMAWSLLGYDQKAKDSARRAYELSSNLNREERLGIEGRYRESVNERAKAIQTYRALFEAFPDSVDYGLQLAAAQTADGKGKEALATVDALRRLSSAAAGDPRIDLAESAAARSLSDFARQQATAARAAEKGQTLGARLLVARARLSESTAWLDLSEPAKALAAGEEARRIYASAGDRGNESRALRSTAVVLRAQGDLSGARRMYEQALATSREIGDRSGTASALNNIGNVLRQQGSLSEARKLYEQSLTISREIADRSGESLALNNLAIALRQQGDLTAAKKIYLEALAIRRDIGEKAGVAATLNNLGNVLYDEGDFNGAKKMYEDTLVIRQEVGDKRGVATSWLNIAGVLRLQGDLAGARGLYEQARALFLETEDKSAVANTTKSLGVVLAAQGNLVDARKRCEEALAIQESIGEKRAAAGSRLALAEIAIEDGKTAEAETLARRSVADLRSEQVADDEAGALAILSRSLLEQGKLREAQESIQRASALAKASTRQTRFSIGVTSARADAAAGRAAAAARTLQAMIGDAKGFVGDEFEARLALGQIEMASGNLAGRARLQALANEASSKGFVLIARRAAATGN